MHQPWWDGETDDDSTSGAASPQPPFASPLSRSTSGAASPTTRSRAQSDDDDSDDTESLHQMLGPLLQHLLEQPDGERKVQQVLAQLGLHRPKQHRPAIVCSFDIEGVARYIQENRVHKIVVLTGAGISVAAGIPDFRSPETGIYARLQEFNLPDPADIFTLSYFRGKPEPFFTLAKELWPGLYAPTKVHQFVRLLSDKGLLLRNYTQNIDGLERVSGTPPEKLVEAHGTFLESHCIDCGRVYPTEFVREKVWANTIPRCTEASCNGLVKPDIVFFGEALPERFFRLAEQDLPSADLVIVIGTSLQVQPFASLPDRAGDEVPRLLINNEVVGTGGFLGGGFDFSEYNYRDCKFIGDCQTAISELCRLLGWQDDLDRLCAEGNVAARSFPPPTPAQFPGPESTWRASSPSSGN
eukprot:TRINITY_DN14738_c0_g1_i1.p2 TRINITY_DN14738_c0_g1~~TRINITY_DN14738_c0_g1_i1.p2  ORF type:complete len:412 (+),score=46.61 TRINITY_DN14738_c0_g1_i1:4095-5330(+)